MDRQRVFAEIRRRGADRALLEFDVGRGEYATGRAILKRDDDELAVIGDDARDPADEEFAEALAAPLEHAGRVIDGPEYADGTLIWNALGETVEISGNGYHFESEPFERRL